MKTWLVHTILMWDPWRTTHWKQHKLTLPVTDEN